LPDDFSIAVTGSSGGVGRLLAEHYANLGRRVYGCSRSESSFQHENYCHTVADISDEDDVGRFFREISRDGRGLGILINNAGLKIDNLAILTPKGQAEDLLRTNLTGAFLVTREAAKRMKRQRFGRIINMSSVAVPLASAGTAFYGASKAALEQFSRTLARELAGDDITVNTIGLSVFLDTGMTESISDGAQAELRKNLLKPGPLEIAEIIHAVDFFASENARNITGQTVYFGGVK
jgi:3-oxoacyl-[acyl-carrier protein] reductase